MTSEPMYNLNVSIKFPNAKQAEIVYNSLRVDPEPQRSLVKKDLRTEDNILIALTIMFHKGRSSGSVSITMKRYDGRNRHLPKDGSKKPDPQEYMCLLRAQVSNSKISTVVHPKDVNKFQQAYCSLLRGNMDGLKKVKKTKTKPKATQ